MFTACNPLSRRTAAQHDTPVSKRQSLHLYDGSSSRLATSALDTMSLNGVTNRNHTQISWLFGSAVSAVSPRRYPNFDVVVGLVRSHDPESYASGSVCYW